MANANKHQPQFATRLTAIDSAHMVQAFSLAKDYPEAINLTVGHPCEPTPNSIKQAGIRAIQQDLTTYTPAAGVSELRSAIANKLQLENNLSSISADNICVTPGLTTAILLIYLATLNPGDEVLLPEPFFPPYRDVAELAGATVATIPSDANFKLTANTLEEYISDNSKLLILNNPSNPSGAVYTSSNLTSIAAVLAGSDITVVSDEIYEYFQTTRHISFATLYNKTITLNGFSKAYAMTGWRLGYIAADVNTIRNLTELSQYLIFSSSSIAQYAALEIFKGNVTPISDRYIEELPMLKQKIAQFTDIAGLEGAFYAFIKTPPGFDDIQAQQVLAENYDLLVLPGRIFSPQTNYIRLAFTRPVEQNLHAIRQLREFYTDNT